MNTISDIIETTEVVDIVQHLIDTHEESVVRYMPSRRITTGPATIVWSRDALLAYTASEIRDVMIGVSPVPQHTGIVVQ